MSCGDWRLLLVCTLKPFCCEIKLYEQEGNNFVRCIVLPLGKKSRLVGAEFLTEGASTLTAIIVSSMCKKFLVGDCRWRARRKEEDLLHRDSYFATTDATYCVQYNIGGRCKIVFGITVQIISLHYSLL